MALNSNQEHLFQEVSTVTVSHLDLYTAAKQDLDVFAALALPIVTMYPYPDLFKELWYLLISYSNRVRDFSKIAVGLPRGFGKTSLVKLAIAYFILYTNKRFTLVLADTATKAEYIVTDIVAILDEPNIRAVFGNWREGLVTDRKELKVFAFRGRSIILAALGQGGSVRGLNIDNQRPDVMLFDDIQSREDADSEIVSNDIYNWMLGTAMKAATHTGCLFIFLANMYPTPHSILRKLKTNPSWIKFIVGGILASGESLWPELKPIGQLLDEYKADCDADKEQIFLAEVMNDESANQNNDLDISKIPVYPFDEDEISAGNFIIIDPSNDTANSDAVSITVNCIINGRPVVRVVKNGRFSPEETIMETLKLALTWQCSLIAVEANAYQYSLCFWFKKYIAKLEAYEINVRPIYSGKKSKNSRILEMFKSWVAGEIYLHPSCAAIVIAQALEFNPKKTNNIDNILDCVTYVQRVLTEFGPLITVFNPLRLGYEDTVADVTKTSPF